MSGPSWLSLPLAVLMILSAAYHADRLWHSPSRSVGRDADATHLAMSLAMAWMLLGSVGPGPALAGALTFVVPTVWFAAVAAQSLTTPGMGQATAPALRQLLSSMAMLFMFAVAGGIGSGAAIGSVDHVSMAAGSLSDVTTSSTASAMTGHGLAVAATAIMLAVVLAVVSTSQSVQLFAALASLGRPAASAGERHHRLPLRLGCQVAMGGAMVYSLALMT